ncbi:hypothetical protein STANM309S_05711 [Streptomyces tanashiensis]
MPWQHGGMQLARGNQSVAVGGDAGVVVTGDVHLTSAAPPVRSAYWEQVRRIAPDRLVGREAELAELAAFCLAQGAGPDSGPAYTWWRAGAWAGKTALLSWFALNPPPGVCVVPFFVTARLGAQNHVGAYVDVLLEQLAELAGEGLPALLTEATREAHLLRLYRSAAEACAARGSRLVLLVDGLDEDRGVTTGPDAHSIAALLPYDLPVIASGRLNPPLPGDVPDTHPLRDPSIVRLLAPSPEARAIRVEAERELKYLLEAGGLPHDLLGLLVAAGGGLTADDLAELTGAVPYRIRDVLRTGPGRTFAVRAGRYLVAHEELQVRAEEMLGARESARHRTALHAWADRWRACDWPEETPAYLLDGYFPLLRAAGDLTRMVECALDGPRQDRLLAATGGDLAALTEIGTAEAALIDAGVPDFLDFLRIVIVREELTGRSDCIPPTLPWAWAELGRYERAEGLARSIISDDWRAQALVDVARRLHRAGRREDAVTLLGAASDAALLCGSVFEDERERTLETVSRGWAHVGLHDRAVETARLVEHPLEEGGTSLRGVPGMGGVRRAGPGPRPLPRRGGRHGPGGVAGRDGRGPRRAGGRRAGPAGSRRRRGRRARSCRWPASPRSSCGPVTGGPPGSWTEWTRWSARRPCSSVWSRRWRRPVSTRGPWRPRSRSTNRTRGAGPCAMWSPLW